MSSEQRDKRILEQKMEDSQTNTSTQQDSSNNVVEHAPKRRKKVKPTKEFQWEKWSSRKIALRVAYIGWEYSGYASQEHDHNTIESKLFEGLMRTKLVKSRESCDYSRCGRTDKGVSAFGNVISLRVRSRMKKGPGIQPGELMECSSKQDEDEELCYDVILNRVLPPDIRIIAWAPVEVDFSSRFSCISRSYKYFFLRNGMSLDTMTDAAKRMVGEHDFRNFCKMDVDNVRTFERTLHSVEISQCSDSAPSLCVCTIKGSAFLWHMVRNIMGVLFMVGEGLEKPDVVDSLLNPKTVPKKPIYDMVSEIPLVLYDCQFKDVHWNENCENVMRITDSFRRMFSDLQLKGAVVSCMLSSFPCASENHSPTQSKTHIPLLLRRTHASYEQALARSKEKEMRRQKGKEECCVYEGNQPSAN